MKSIKQILCKYDKKVEQGKFIHVHEHWDYIIDMLVKHGHVKEENKYKLLYILTAISEYFDLTQTDYHIRDLQEDAVELLCGCHN